MNLKLETTKAIEYEIEWTIVSYPMLINDKYIKEYPAINKCFMQSIE